MRKLVIMACAGVAASLLAACGGGSKPSGPATPCVEIQPGQPTSVGTVQLQMQSDGDPNLLGAKLTVQSPVASAITVQLHIRDWYDGEAPEGADASWGSTLVHPGAAQVLAIPAAPYGHRNRTRITGIKVCLAAGAPLSAPAQAVPSAVASSAN